MANYKVTFGTGYFAFNNDKYPKGQYSVHGGGNEIIVKTIEGREVEVYKGTFTDASDQAYANVAAVLTALNAAFVLNSSVVIIGAAATSLNFGSIAAAAQANLTITVTGAAAGMGVVLGVPATLEAGLIPFAFVSAANTVTVRMTNITGDAIDPAAANYTVQVISAY
jgi:hypothetical protein